MAETFDEAGLIHLYQSSRNPPIAHLGHAALFFQYMFEFREIPAAFWGGWACFLRGEMGRQPMGVHVVVRCTMERLVQLLYEEIRTVFQKHVGPI
jgi:hypothetical protein